MNNQDSNWSPEPDPDPGSNLYTLDPLRSDGPDALDTRDVPGITKITLREIEVRCDNAVHEVFKRRADDVFACSPNPDDHTALIARDETLSEAEFDLLFPDSERPHKLTIRPPHSIKLEFPADTNRVLPWLDMRRFRLHRRLAHTIAVLLLALASAFSPAIDDDDDPDDDGTEPHRFTLRA